MGNDTLSVHVGKIGIKDTTSDTINTVMDGLDNEDILNNFYILISKSYKFNKLDDGPTYG